MARTVQKTMLQHVQSDIIHIFVCLEKGGVLVSHPDGGGMQFYDLGIGGVNIFFLTPRRCLPPSPLKFMNSPLIAVMAKRGKINNTIIIIGPAVRADFRRLYLANAKIPTCCPSDDNRTKVTNSVTSARSLWWHVGPYFWPAELTRTANPIVWLQINSN